MTTQLSQHSEHQSRLSHTSSDHIVSHLSEVLRGDGTGSKDSLQNIVSKELVGFIETNLDLIKAVFHNRTIPFLVDKNLSNLLPWVQHPDHLDVYKSILKQYPDMSSEGDMAKWLNDIGEALRQLQPQPVNGRYIDIHGKLVLHPERVWRSNHSNVALECSCYRLKPDLILVDEGGRGKLAWPAVHVVGETNKTTLNKS